MVAIVLFLLCGLCESALSKTEQPKGRLSSPVFSVNSKQLVIPANQTLQLECKGLWPLSWAYPGAVSTVGGRLAMSERRCGKGQKLYCSSLSLHQARAQDTGSFSCRYDSKKKRRATVYVYFKDASTPFVELHSDIPEVVYIMQGSPLVVPCRVSAPDIPVTLIKFPTEKLITDGTNIKWNSKQGFVIPSPLYRYIGLLSCETTVNGRLYSTKYITHRQVNTILDVYLNATSLVKTLKGDTLALNCTAIMEANARVVFHWSYPGKVNNTATIKKRMLQGSSNSNLFYSILTIRGLRSSDHGLYSCRVQSGPTSRQTNTTVLVYEKPFINLKYRHAPIVDVTAGQKFYRLSTKLRAFPSPEVIWLKDGKVAAEQCSRYKVEGNFLVIRDVSEEDAGVYTILVGIQQYSLFRNLTISLVVNVEPHVVEKAVSLQDPDTYPQGSRQALLCTTYGFPPPRLQWLWHPCPRTSGKGLCKLSPLTRRRRVRVTANSTDSENPILSITQRTELLEGKNKTVGVLVVEQARVSGVYRCVASNKVGKDRRNIPFLVSEIPSGFSVELEEVPMEGAGLRLVCKANRYLYTDLAWHLPTQRATQLSGVWAEGMELSTGQYSNSLLLRIYNVSQEHAGIYACSARNVRTGEIVRLESSVQVIALEAPQLLRNLSNQSVNVSSSVTLACLAQGVPEPQLAWYKDNHKLTQGSGILLSTGGSTLHIERITKEDEGLYTCEATNERGSVESSAYLTVEDSADKSNLEIPTLTCTCVVATLFWLLLTLFIRKLKRPTSAEIKTDYLSIIMDPGEVPLDEQCERLPYDASKWEFPRDRLKLEKPLGRGAFGKVMQASAFGINKSSTCRTVAVKMLKEGATGSEHKALMTELKILIHIGQHLNVVNLLGACTKYGGPLMVIVEFCKYGNLSNYLKSKRDVFLLHKDSSGQAQQDSGGGSTGAAEVGAAEVGAAAEARGEEKERLDSVSSTHSSASSGFEDEKSLHDTAEEQEDSDAFYNKPIVMEDLISYSFQVARGMEFLASRKCIHRDLAARNILLSENNVVKICDFGLARDIYKDPDYVRKGDARLPLKWMSPESIFDKVYTTQSDVWSYGVLLWEIFSLGASPYPGVQIDEDFCSRLKEGTRMRAPEYATADIYNTMLACWEAEPRERPTFPQLVETLGDLLQASVKQDGKDYIPLNTVLSPSSAAPSSGEGTAAGELLGPRLSFHSAGSLGNINTKRSQSVKTFEEISVSDGKVWEDYQSDSGMVLPSEELQSLRWSAGRTRPASPSPGFRALSKSRESVLSAVVRPGLCSTPCGHREEEPPMFSCISNTQEPCCSPPPDYNSAVFYPPL
ncbi:vascular endothelial growth factor receptor 1 isoform X2 [Amia ocellicauda]|uniref:vascular endothelial growth factor receptor 1 isoform X2 n=1 Tax=Amia ocellicauda TaxID=2972642 RepID=UPI0034638F3A